MPHATARQGYAVGAPFGRSLGGVVSPRAGCRASAIALLILAGVVGSHALN